MFVMAIVNSTAFCSDTFTSYFEMETQTICTRRFLQPRSDLPDMVFRLYVSTWGATVVLRDSRRSFLRVIETTDN